MIAVEGVSYHYPDGRAALRGVTFSVAEGERVAIIGPNGAGKSTLLLHLNGLLSPTVGRVEVAGLPVATPNLAAVRALVGFVFQNPDDQLFALHVYEDVAYGPRHMGLGEEEIRQRVHAALAAVEMEGFEQHVSHHLSLGQKKRVALATVLSMQPRVLALDEPSAGLDPRARRRLIALLARSRKTLILATHDMRLTAQLATRVIILDEGRIVADGSAAAVLHDEPLLLAHGLERP